MKRLMLIVQDDTDNRGGWTVIDYDVITTSNNEEELYGMCHEFALRLKMELAAKLTARLKGDN